MTFSVRECRDLCRFELLNVPCSSNAAPPQKFGALNIMAALGPFIMRHPEVKGSMEDFMMRHVLPEFTASEPYMRAIVSQCLALSPFSDVNDWRRLAKCLERS